MQPPSQEEPASTCRTASRGLVCATQTQPYSAAQRGSGGCARRPLQAELDATLLKPAHVARPAQQRRGRVHAARHAQLRPLLQQSQRCLQEQAQSGGGTRMGGVGERPCAGGVPASTPPSRPRTRPACPRQPADDAGVCPLRRISHTRRHLYYEDTAGNVSWLGARHLADRRQVWELARARGAACGGGAQTRVTKPRRGASPASPRARSLPPRACPAGRSRALAAALARAQAASAPGPGQGARLGCTRH